MAHTHDSAYKQLFSHPEMVRDLLSGFAPYVWAGGLQVDAFERVNASYVGGNLVRQRSITAHGKLPPVLPVVLYNGSARWTGSTDMAGLIMPPPEGLLGLQPEQRYLLIDQSSYGNAELAAQVNLAAALFRLEHSRTYQDSRRVIVSLMIWLKLPQYASLRQSFAQWIAGRLKHQLREDRCAKAGNALEELSEVDIMIEQKFEYWEDMWENEAIEKGMAKGLQQGIEQGLEQGRQEGKLVAMREVSSSYLHKRFGELPRAVLVQLDNAELLQIEQWLEHAYDGKQLPDLFERQ